MGRTEDGKQRVGKVGKCKDRGALAHYSSMWGSCLRSFQEKKLPSTLRNCLCNRQMVALEPEVLGLNPGLFP